MADGCDDSISDSDDIAAIRDDLKAAIESFPGLFLIVSAVNEDDGTADFRVEMANSAACDVLGMSIEDIKGESVRALFPVASGTPVLERKLDEASLNQRTVDFDPGALVDSDDPAGRWRARCVPDGRRLFLSITKIPTPAVPNVSAGGLTAGDFGRAVEASPVGIVTITIHDGIIENANPVMGRIMGTRAGSLLGSRLADSVALADRPTVGVALETLRLNPDVSQHVVLTLAGVDGKQRNVEIAMTTAGGGRALLQVLDRTEEIGELTLFSQRADDFGLLVGNTSNTVLRLDTAGQIRWASPSVEDFLGVSAANAVGQPVTRFTTVEFSPAVNSAVISAVAGNEVRDLPLRVRRRDGDSRWVRSSVLPFRTARGDVGGVVVVLQDSDAELKTTAKLEDLALRDPLSGMGTRQAMVARLTEELEAPGARLSLLEVHLDQLRRLNDEITFSAADEVITTLGQRLTALIGARGEVYRISGSDFGIIVRETESASQARALAEWARTVCGQPIKVGEFTVTPSVSVGVASAEGSDVHRLLYDAHRAMRIAKACGRNQVATADDRGGLEATRWLVDESELNDALREGRYAAFFQPIVTLPDGALAGFEVLVRCRQPDGSAVLPAGQMAIAEATGLIKDIDRLVMRQALALLKSIDSRYFMSINASVRSLADPSYLPWVEKLVDDVGVEPSRVTIEVTESTALAVPPSVRRAMERFADRGFSWYLDDFGTGYSSLSSLRDLPMSGLKLDRSFTALVVADSNRVRDLTQGVVRLADQMGLTTVVEGVEKQQEADLLAAQGWKFGQGWLFGRAMSADAARLLACGTPASAGSGPS